MKLFLISQPQLNQYDVYEHATVAAPDEASARFIHPGSSEDEPITWTEARQAWENKYGKPQESWGHPDWVAPKEVEVEWIGTAANEVFTGVISRCFSPG